ncbi:hypothetical protein [Stenotrophomonas maltophilia]|uniref:hypothetical protein n=1 Tax=Stenotrophomonas maltophilia TaxID=40324 RepID=UPI00209B15EA|nr:hypothetical protein [Stenotrophomonas maltophilia]MCO7473060.1 hypothetical protein [Stenotrophomonas maltophilia]
MTNNPTPEELRRLQELAEMFDDGPSMAPTPSPERPAPSPGASEVMNAAKHWGRVFGRKAKALSEKALEKSKEAQDTIARRAPEAKAKKEAEAAQHADLEAERAQEAAAAISTAAPAEPLRVEPEATSPPVVKEAVIESEDDTALLERLVPMEANAKKAAKEIAKALRENPAVAALIHDGMGMLAPQLRDVPSMLAPQLRDVPSEVVAPVTPDHQSPSVPKFIHQGAPVASTTPDHVPNNVPSRRKGWQTLAGAALVVLVLVGVTAWWVTHHDSETPAAPAATPTAAAVPPVVAIPRPAPVVDPLPVAVPVERELASPAQEESKPEPVVILPDEAPAAAAIPAAIPEAKPTPKGSTSAVRSVAKPKATAITAPRPKPDETNGWQEKAEGDMDAWAKKAGIN